MKLPRWLVCGLLGLSSMSLLGLLLWWWVLWPEETCRVFLAHCAAAEFDEAGEFATADLEEYLSSDPLLRKSLSYREEEANWPIPTLAHNPKREWCPRKLSELLTGRQRIVARGADMKGTRFTVYDYQLTALFGQISCQRTARWVIQD